MILLRVSLIFLVLFLLPDWYIYKTYLTSLHHRRWKRAYWLPTVLLLLILVIFLIGHDTLHEYFGTYMLSSILLKLFRRLVKRPVPHGWIALAPALLTFGYVLFGAIKGKENFQVKEVTFYSPDLPDAFDGYRILHSFRKLERERKGTSGSHRPL